MVISPVLEVRFRPIAVNPRDYDGLIFTSENGVRAVAASSDLQGLRGYAVGAHTAEVGAEFGLRLKPSAGSAEDLVDMIMAERPSGRWLHPRGVHSRGNVAERLKEVGIETDSVIAYEQIECPPSPKANALLAKPGMVILPVFSPRTAAILGQMCQGALASLVLIGMSPAVLTAWTGPNPTRRIALSEPTSAAMLEEIQRHIGRVA